MKDGRYNCATFGMGACERVRTSDVRRAVRTISACACM